MKAQLRRLAAIADRNQNYLSVSADDIRDVAHKMAKEFAQIEDCAEQIAFHLREGRTADAQLIAKNLFNRLQL